MSAAAPSAYRGDFQLQASPSKVFEFLTNAELLTRWWPDSAETDPTDGGSYHLSWEGPGWHLRGEYITVQPADRLVFTWKWDHDETPARRVDIRLSFLGAGTTGVVIEHDAASEEERSGYQEGWEFFLPQLREALAAND